MFYKLTKAAHFKWYAAKWIYFEFDFIITLSAYHHGYIKTQ